MSRSFVLLMADRRPIDPSADARLGITVSRRVGPSVVRSRVKRRLREWFRTHRAEIPRGKDIVVIARSAAASISQVEIERELGVAMTRLPHAMDRT
jgi:ribonuclease P protein component